MKRRLRIIQDTDAFNPRTDYDCHVGRMLCWHRRYNLGDDHSYDCDDWKRELACEADDDLEESIEFTENDGYDIWYAEAEEAGLDDPHDYAQAKVDAAIAGLVDRAFDAGYVALPLYLYDHSGITMSTGRFSCPWDSGCVGVIVCDRATVEKEFNGDEDRAEAALRAEVEEYDNYLTGNCWGFIAEELIGDDWTEVDSCWGFLGNPEDVVDSIDGDWTGVDLEIEYA